MSGNDDVLDTLLLPFSAGQLTWSDDAGFLRARTGASLSALANKSLICEQSFKSEADALQRMGFSVAPALQDDPSGKKFSLILILPPRQRDEARTLFARAVSLVKPGGIVIAAAANNEGARSLEDDLQKLTGSISTLSKNKCRVFWSSPGAQSINLPLLSEWSELDRPRPILNGRYISRPGLFAWDRVDIASALLAKHLPADLNGVAADLGSGFGYLSDELLQKCSGIKSLHVYEAEHRALELAKLNLEKCAKRVQLQYYWHDVTAGLSGNYDVIVSNPPFHAQGSRDRPDIGRRFIAVAAQSVNPGGKLFIVANRHLPYEQVLTDGFDSVTVLAEQQGFKVIAASKKQLESKRVRK